MMRAALTLATAIFVGCSPDGNDGIVAGLPVLSLDEPLLEIGAIEGPEELAFAAIESVVRLPDGTVAVSDAGATRISLFDADGAFLRSWGRQGDGPGEFRSLSRIYPLGRDSLMAAERFSGRLAVYDLGGDLGRLQSGAELSGDSVFTLDSWLHGRFWIDGALTAAERRRVATLLDDLTVPRAAPGYRFAHATEDGALWIREPRDGGGDFTWTRIADGRPTAVIVTPASFRPTQIRVDEVLGVWSGESGVHFARAYRPAPTGESAPAPAWLRGVEAGVTPAPTPDDEELMAEVRSSIMAAARAQEIHYSGNMTYTSVIDSLEAFERPETLAIDFLRADARGWSAVFTHAAVDRVCALAYGSGSPPGWSPGMIVCAPDVAPQAAEGP
jgi:hypothetical protein